MKETIEIAWIKVLKQRLQAEPNWIDVFEKDWEYYFTRSAAMRESKAQWLSLLSPKQFKKMAKSFDWYVEGKRCKAYKTLADALWLKLSGSRYSDGAWYCEDDGGYLWSSVGRRFFFFNRDNGKLHTTNEHFSFPAVVFEDSTIWQFDNSEKEPEKKLSKEEIKKWIVDNSISSSSAYDIALFVKDFNLL